MLRNIEFIFIQEGYKYGNTKGKTNNSKEKNFKTPKTKDLQISEK